jgi:hypothetical protein
MKALLVALAGICALPPVPAVSASGAQEVTAPSRKPAKVPSAPAIPPRARTTLRIERDTLVVDAREGRLLFPLATTGPRFKDQADLWRYAQRAWGATLRQDAKGRPWAVSFRTRQLGSSVWVQPRTGIVHQVADPVLASLGGLDGRFGVGSATYCADADGRCDDGLPSYLKPGTRKTLRSNEDSCSGDGTYCAQHHSFFNRVVELGFFKYARHGANTRINAGTSQPRLSVFPCAAGAEAPPAGTEVRGLSITIRTGDDDLRGGSDVSVRVPGVTTAFVSLNGGAGLGNGSVHTGSITLPPGTRAEQVTSLEFRYRSGDCVACTTDNWNVDELLVSYSSPGGVSGSLFAARGHPLVRFTEDRPRWSVAVSRAPLPADATPSGLRFTLRTGGDDLRGGSDVHARVPGITDWVPLNPGSAGFANGTVTTALLPLPRGTRLDAVTSIELRHTSGHCVACTTDNWDLDELLVETVEAKSNRVLLQRTGAPWVRFTGASPQIAIAIALTPAGALCGETMPGRRLAITSSLVKFVNVPALAGAPHWEALGIAPGEAFGADWLEISAGGLTLAGRTDSDGSSSPAGAPSFLEADADGICSRHTDDAGGAETGNGNHQGAVDTGLCP